MPTWLRKLAHLLHRDRTLRELDEELQFHLDMTQRDLHEAGLPARDAREAARRRVGNPLRLRERAADVWLWQPLDAFAQDLRFAWRMLRKQPAFTLIAAVTLALGIGANTALFSVANAFFLRPPPVAQPDRLVWLFTVAGGRAFGELSYPAYVTVRDRADVFAGMAAYQGTAVTLTIDRQSDTYTGYIVSANFFDVVGVHPALGRAFLPDEERTPARVAILSDQLWRERFSGNPAIVGRTLPINGEPFTIVGVMPPAFTGMNVERATDVWVPMSMQPLVRPPSATLRSRIGTNDFLSQPNVTWLRSIARLAPGMTAAQAQAAVVSIGHQLARDYPGTAVSGGLNLTRVIDGPPSSDPALSRGLMLLFGIVGLVLVIACANVASLALARASTRVREVAVRLALGVSRGRLIRQLLTEHLLVALCGGALGLGLAAWLVRLLPTLLPPGPRPLMLDLSLDWRVLAFATTLSLVTGVAFGLLPAVAASRQDLVATIREGSNQAGTTRSRVRRTLVVAQVALSLLLLIASGLFIRGLQGATAVDPGFDRRAPVLVASMSVRPRGYTDAQTDAFSRALLDRLRAQPGVRAVSLSHTLPLGFATRWDDMVPEEARAPGGAARTYGGQTNRVTPGYFEALGIRPTSGRLFTDEDRAGAPLVCVVNDTLAARFWPSQNPIGRRLSIDGNDGPLLEVVGVVPQGRYRSIGEEPVLYVYVPWFQQIETMMGIVVRTAGNPTGFVPILRRELAALDPYIPLENIRTLDEHVHMALAFPRLAAAIVSVFGLVALALACIGLYGLMAHAVTQRTRELGVRVALGATHGRVLQLILNDAFRLTLIGLAIGVAAALALTRLLTSVLYGTSPRDPIAFVTMSILLLVVSLLAAVIPARRAMRVDPVQALRLD